MYRHCRVALALIIFAMAFAAFAQDGSGSSSETSESAGSHAAFDTYIIQSGDSLYGIAQRFNTTVGTLMSVNGISDEGRIVSGQVLLIPALEETPVNEYEVQPGDSLFSISQRFNTTVGMLQSVNGLGESSEIVAGQIIVVPTIDESRYQVYVVAADETLLRIAERYGLDVAALMALNEIAEDGELAEGQTILLPRIDESKFAVHIVKSGDTLTDISRLYNTTVAQLGSLNDFEDEGGLSIGRSVIVPRVDETFLERYIVKAGDSLYSIAKRFDAELPVLQALNQLADVRDIRIDQVLLVPKLEGARLKIHVLRLGDTLEQLAERYETTVEQLKSLNGIADPSLIALDKAILVPEAREIPVRPGFGFGIQVFVDAAQADALAQRAKSLGVDWVKIDVAWAAIETAPEIYSYSALDSMVAAMQLAGLRIVLNVYDAPEWSRSSYLETLNSQFRDYTGPPEKLEDFASFLANLVTRYAGLVDAYEIWKSPNLVKFWTVPVYTRPQEKTEDGDFGIPDEIHMSALHYVPLLKLAYNTIKAHDGEAMVIAAGLAPAGYNDNYNAIDTVTFLNEMLDAGAAAYSDAIGVIFSASAVPPTLRCCEKPPGVDTHYESFLQYFGDLLSFYGETLKKREANLPLMVTQLGWGTTEGANLAVPATGFEWLNYTNEEEQGLYIAQAFNMVQNLEFVDAIFLYNLNGCAVGDREACFFSLEDAEGRLRPAYEAFRTVPKHSE
jgi:LysM repeat protein